MTDQSASNIAPTSPLGHREYRELWGANVASNFGGQIQVVGAGWLMSSLTNSPQLIALVQAASNFSTVCLILLGGALADSFDRRRIMLTTQTSMLLVACLLAVLTWQNHIEPWSLLLLTFTISGLNSLNSPAWQASVRDILPRAMISKAVGLNGTSINLARTVGPALGGFLVMSFGVAAAFVANALSFTGFLAALIRWTPKRVPHHVAPEPILPAMLAGMRYALLAPPVRNAVIRGCFSGIAVSAIFSLMPVLARQEMGGDAGLYGLLLAAFGTGAVISALSGARFRERFCPDHVVWIGSAALASGLVILAVSSNPWLSGLGAALGGGGWSLTHGTLNTSVQLSAPKWVTARALALYQMSTFGGMAIGSTSFGWVAEHYDTSTALLAAGVIQVGAVLIGLFYPLPRYEDLRVDPLETGRNLAIAGEIGPNKGPITVELHFNIAPENVDSFRSAMKVRARIRKRDGAKDWSLRQSLADSSHWIESYRVADWADYLRYVVRQTEADRENYETLLALNSDPSGPTVHRYLEHRQ